MGIFDDYFDPKQFEAGGGILGLLQTMQQQSAYQPSQGFAQMPDRNVAVGDYQMPQFGSAPAPYSGPTDVSASARQPMPASAPMSAPPAAPQQETPGIGDRLQAGLQGFGNNLQAGPLGAIVGGLGGLVSGKSSNPDAATFAALTAAGVPSPLAQAAVKSGNPEMLKFALERYGKQQPYSFSSLPDGTVVRQNPTSGEVAPAFQGGTKRQWGIIGEQEGGGKQYGWIDSGKGTVAPYQSADVPERSATVTGPDGKEIAIPAGSDRKTFVKKISEINAEAAGGKKTEVQAKSEKFGNQMELAEKNVKGLDDQFTGSIGGNLSRATESGGGATRWMQSDDYQKYVQGRNSFLTALLRDESGAAIGSAEFDRREKEMFPQPGDGPAVVQQKRELRRVAIEGMKKAAGPGYQSSSAPAAASPQNDPLGLR